VLLANGSAGAGPTDGTGGQGVKPLPMVHDGWIQPTVRLAAAGDTSAEVAGWIALLTPEQRDPESEPQTPGDLNCDCRVDFFDIDAFLLAQFNPAGYHAAFPQCDLRNADGNEDRRVDFFDIDPFVALLFQ
jgi:hypothetical protein